MNKFRKSILATALMGIGISSALAAAPVSNTGNQFTMLSSAGGLVGDDFGVSFTWDGTYNTDVATAAINATLASPNTFFGYVWTAHDVQIYGPGTYNFPAVGANPGYSSVTVGAGQVGIHMLFDWGATSGIEVVEICEPGTFSGGATSWDCASIDGDGDSVLGNAMNNGPFTGFNANFNLMGLIPQGGAASGGTVVVTAPATMPASGPAGGGCAYSPFGDDGSLLAALLASFAYVGWRRRSS